MVGTRTTTQPNPDSSIFFFILLLLLREYFMGQLKQKKRSKVMDSAELTIRTSLLRI